MFMPIVGDRVIESSPPSGRSDGLSQSLDQLAIGGMVDGFNWRGTGLGSWDGRHGESPVGGDEGKG